MILWIGASKSPYYRTSANLVNDFSSKAGDNIPTAIFNFSDGGFQRKRSLSLHVTWYDVVRSIELLREAGDSNASLALPLLRDPARFQDLEEAQDQVKKLVAELAKATAQIEQVQQIVSNLPEKREVNMSDMKETTTENLDGKAKAVFYRTAADTVRSLLKHYPAEEMPRRLIEQAEIH